MQVIETPNEMIPDFTVCFRPVEHLAVPAEGTFRKESRYYQYLSGQEEVWHSEMPGKTPYVYTNWVSDRQMVCEYAAGKESCLCYSGNICDVIGLETVLLKIRGFILHASFIQWRNKGILFTAPSGTGKTTQAELWEVYENAKILNGDRAGIRKADGIWQASGLPFAGSSRIYRNESADIAAIIVLRQAKENSIRRLKTMEAVRCLYPEITVHQWDEEQVNEVLSILQELVMDIPVYMLQCLPDRDAVKLVKETVMKDL